MYWLSFWATCNEGMNVLLIYCRRNVITVFASFSPDNRNIFKNSKKKNRCFWNTKNRANRSQKLKFRKNLRRYNSTKLRKTGIGLQSTTLASVIYKSKITAFPRLFSSVFWVVFLVIIRPLLSSQTLSS